MLIRYMECACEKNGVECRMRSITSVCIKGSTRVHLNVLVYTSMTVFVYMCSYNDVLNYNIIICVSDPKCMRKLTCNFKIVYNSTPIGR